MMPTAVRPLINVTRGGRVILFQSTVNIRPNLTSIQEKVEPSAEAEIFKDSWHHKMLSGIETCLDIFSAVI